MSSMEKWGEAFNEQMRSAQKALPHHVGLRKKALPGVGFTTGEWAGVVQLARAKGRYVLPPRPTGIRKNRKVAKP
jgi:hypothetical protein